MTDLISVENITSKIFMIRGFKVMLDRDLAGFSKYLSMAFTEQGVAMLSSVLKSKRAIHPRKGKLAGLPAVSSNITYRIILELIIREKESILVNAGTHEEAY